jgi:hypothetical protein
MVTKANRARQTTVRKKVEIKTTSTYLDKAIDLIKWVDSPFKLGMVIVLASLFFIGYLTYDSKQVLLNAIVNHDKLPQLKDRDNLLPTANALRSDLDAMTVIVHKVNIVTNTRITVLAMNEKGIDKSLDGVTSSLFSADASRNSSIITMLNGEVYCDKLVVSGKTSEWETKNGVTFICRGSIPPPIGEFAGYVSVGFKTEPADLVAVRARINFASLEMAK